MSANGSGEQESITVNGSISSSDESSDSGDDSDSDSDSSSLSSSSDTDESMNEEIVEAESSDVNRENHPVTNGNFVSVSGSDRSSSKVESAQDPRSADEESVTDSSDGDSDADSHSDGNSPKLVIANNEDVNDDSENEHFHEPNEDVNLEGINGSVPDMGDGKRSNSEPRVSANGVTYPCNMCNRVYKSVQTRNKHMKAAHKAVPVNVSYFCPTCMAGFLRKQDFDLHNKELHSKRVQNSPIQQRPAPVKRQKPASSVMSKQRKNDSDVVPPLPTKLFEETLSSSSESELEDESIPCTVCHFETRSKRESSMHFYSHTSDFDEQTWLTCYTLATPQEDNHDDDRTSSSSSEDELTFLKTSTFLENELESKPVAGDQMTKKLYPCQGCDMVFSRSSARALHMSKKHQESMSYQCQFCSRGFVKEGNLMIHLQKCPNAV